jgi:hypothetical protein
VTEYIYVREALFSNFEVEYANSSLPLWCKRATALLDSLWACTCQELPGIWRDKFNFHFLLQDAAKDLNAPRLLTRNVSYALNGIANRAPFIRLEGRLLARYSTQSLYFDTLEAEVSRLRHLCDGAILVLRPGNGWVPISLLDLCPDWRIDCLGSSPPLSSARALLDFNLLKSDATKRIALMNLPMDHSLVQLNAYGLTYTFIYFSICDRCGTPDNNGQLVESLLLAWRLLRIGGTLMVETDERKLDLITRAWCTPYSEMWQSSIDVFASLLGADAMVGLREASILFYKLPAGKLARKRTPR